MGGDIKKGNKTTHRPRYRRGKVQGQRRTWRPSMISALICVVGLVSTAVLLYPTASSWIAQLNQSKVIHDFDKKLEQASPSAAEQIQRAITYNNALSSGVDLRAGANMPSNATEVGDRLVEYRQQLSSGSSDMMARVLIPSINVDLPIYHGTSDETLLRGSGHLEGSHLPVGGKGTRSVLTAHRGLASAQMFSDLDKVKMGDKVLIDVFGEVLSYKVSEIKVIAPEESDSLRAVEGEDLVTLVTCTPLGINTHRIVVTATRVTPTSEGDKHTASTGLEVPGFPWWLVVVVIVGVGLTAFMWRAGFSDQKRREEMAAAVRSKTESTQLRHVT